MLTRLRSAYSGFAAIGSRTQAAALLLARIALATVFWRSGLTKVETVELFRFTFPDWLQNLSVIMREGEGPFRVRAPLPVIQDDTFFLFREEFFGDYFPEACWADAPSAGCAAGFFFVDVAAVAATIGEIVFPILLVFGFLTRLGAFGLLAMTLVIQAFVFPSFSHWINPAMWWAATAWLLWAHGGGAWSLDALLARHAGASRGA